MNNLPRSLKNIFIPFLLVFFSLSTTAQCFTQISSKFDQVVAIDSDSTLWTWGGVYGPQRSYSTPFQIDTNKNWVQVSTGEYFSFGLKSDGTLWAWGYNSYGQLGNGSYTRIWAPTRVTSDSNWVQVSCGEEFTVARKSDGTVWAWGRNDDGELGQGTNRTSQTTPIQIGTDTNFIDISAGRDFTLLRKSDKTLWHVGSCYYSTISSQLTQVGTFSNWETMAAGSYINYAIRQTGALWEFANSNGRPSGLTRIGTSNDWQKADNAHCYSPYYHALFIKTNGTLWAIGNNLFGQFGNGNLTNSTTPVQVGSDTDWEQVIAGQFTSFALKNDNSFWAWGRNNLAQFGNGQNNSTILPISSNHGWKTASAATGTSNSHVLGIKSNGTLWSWGQNNDGQLGAGIRYVSKTEPEQAGTDTDWKSVTNGFHFSLAIKNNGTLWGWGRNSREQLGIGFGSNYTTPTQVGTDSDWLKVSAGSEFSIGLKTDSTLWAWGYNYDGQIGNGTTTTQVTPVQIGTDSNWISIATGISHSVALRADSTVWTWGDNRYGKLGRNGNGMTPLVINSFQKFLQISAGGEHTLAIAADSSLWACGYNNSSQLGNNSINSSNSFVLIDSVNNWIKIDAGKNHSLGITSDSSLWAWGLNAAGQLGDSATFTSQPFTRTTPTLISNEKWIEITGGVHSSFAIRSDGILFSMGDSFNPSWGQNFPIRGFTQKVPLLLKTCIVCNNTSAQLSQTICQGDSFSFGGMNLTSPGSYIDTISNIGGCDSVISLQLAVTPIDLTVNLLGTTLTSNELGANYQWLDCNNSYASIVGENFQSFTPSLNGDYAVEITSNGCIDTSACLLINTVGISENLLANSIKVYPNPTTNAFQLEFSVNHVLTITLINNQGQIIETRLNSGKGVEHFSLAALKSGIYLLRIQHNKESVLLKVVKR